MSKRVKVFLPRWVGRVIVPALVLLWAGITYDALFAHDKAERISVVGWLGITAVLLGTGVLIWLQSSGKLPAYEIELDEDAGEGAGKDPAKIPHQR